MEKGELKVIDQPYYSVAEQVAILEAANSPLYWNRLTIKDGAHHDKEQVLEGIIREVQPCLLIPALYQVDGEDSFFLFRSGKPIVRKLMEKGLRIGGSIQSQVVITINYLTVEDEPYDVNVNIADVIKKRTNLAEKIVDLRNFKNDSDFKNVYVSLQSPMLMMVVCKAIRKGLSSINALLLSHNGLDKLDIMDSVKKNFPPISSLDVRHNKITYSGFERTARFIEAKHLFIEGNPLCNDYQTPGEMISEMKKMLPSLQTLDNVDIGLLVDDRVNLKVYLRNPRYSPLVDHFLHHYHTIFEKDRDKLIQTYHNQATFSISVLRLEEMPFFSIMPFLLTCNRNLLSMSDITKTYDNIFTGKIRIFEALQSLPTMSFDPYSFTIDVPVTAKKEIVIVSCTGLFIITDQSPDQNKYTFNRVCVLSPLKNGLGEWLILNDMWTIIPSTNQSSKNLIPVRDKPITSDFAVMLNPQLKDRDILIRVVGDLTNMKSVWVEKYLSDSRWDLEMTLLSFTDQFKANLIPSEAFNLFPKT